MPFKSGDEWNGNKDGRPKGSGLCLTTLLKQHLERKPEGKKEYYKDLFIKTLLHKALIEKDIQALKLIINYCDGLPTQAIDLTTQGDKLPAIEIKQIQGMDEKKLDDYFDNKFYNKDDKNSN